MMLKFEGSTPCFSSGVYVCNLPPDCNEVLLADHFGKIGLLKKDKRTGSPKIWVYRDKVTNEIKGDATITYEDPHAAVAAVEWFNNTDFHGHLISVSIAESKKDFQQVDNPSLIVDAPSEGVVESGAVKGDYGGDNCGDFGGGEYGGGAGVQAALAEGRDRGGVDFKPWQQEGDWPCPNPSCTNVNFAFRGVCNRCGTARPAGNLVAFGGGTGGGRSRGRGASDAGGRGGRGFGGPQGLFGPNDWNCPMCGNINWAKRTKCNICNTTKPGHNEGGAREGRAGGYKEFDEAEIEETKRRRRELEEDDGEMYDEFGNLKKKFRAKARLCDTQASSTFAAAGVGKAGWDKEELGVVEQSKEKGKDRSGYKDDKDPHSYHVRRSLSRDVEGTRNSDHDRDNEKDRGRTVDERDNRESYQDPEWERGVFPDRGQGQGHSRGRDRNKEPGWGRRFNERSRDSERDPNWEGLRGRKRVRERDRLLE